MTAAARNTSQRTSNGAHRGTVIDRVNSFDILACDVCGFRHVLPLPTAQEQRLLMGENYIGNDALGRACHLRRKQFDLALESAGLGEVHRKLYGALTKAGIGREAIIVARKPKA